MNIQKQVDKKMTADEVFKGTLDTNDVEERIRVLEALLHILDSGYSFDYDDYFL